MHIAILGATSQIAKDLVQSFMAQSEHQLSLFARSPQVVTQWLKQSVFEDLEKRHQVLDFTQFSAEAHFDALINFVGVGNPAQAVAMGASIFDVILQYDTLALDYVRSRPQCKYIFLSSGAVYGANFNEPASHSVQASIAINHLQPQDWYGAAKLHAECRHRALAHLPIVDIRVFNYISASTDASAAFFTSEMLRAIQTRTTLAASRSSMVRDYLGPEDFHQLVQKILTAPATNAVVDCYTLAPVEKMALLAAAQERYGLVYTLSDAATGTNATGLKKNYFSTHPGAQAFGYAPTKTALANVLHAFDVCLGK
jgi:nucleoside-diphosphate-sugar epimerase